jgi:uncharacterized membrane protein
MTKKQRIVRRILLTLVTFAFFAVGSAKLLGVPMEVSMFTNWGYPLWFMYATGAVEVLGSIGINVKKVSRYATISLSVVAVGAIATHVFHGEGLVAPIPATILLLSLFGILYLGKGEEVQGGPLF